MAALFEAVPKGQPSQYYRYHHVFNFTLQRLVFFAAMAHYMEKEEMLLKVRKGASIYSVTQVVWHKVRLT